MLFAVTFAFIAFVATSIWALCGAAIKNRLKKDSWKGMEYGTRDKADRIFRGIFRET
jgi:hypothetical protein